MAEGARRVFISYARVDAKRVDALVEGMRQLHYDAWVDKLLTGGQAWWDAVLAQIRDSDAVLVAVSPAALESVAVRREYEYGHAVGRPLLPVTVNRVRLEMLPSLLALLQVVDYSQPDTNSAFALAAALAALPAPQALPQPLPEPPPVPQNYLSTLKERSLATVLSIEEQLALVGHLRGALGRPNERTDAEEILRSLQNRPDLYYVTALEIGPLLSAPDRPGPPVTSQPAPDVHLLEAPTAPLRKLSTGPRREPPTGPRREPPTGPRREPPPGPGREPPPGPGPLSGPGREPSPGHLWEPSPGHWVVNQLVASHGRLVLELIRRDTHILECRRRASIAVFLDWKPVGKPSPDGQTFQFRDGGELVEAWIARRGDYAHEQIDLRLGGGDLNSYRIP
jgi:hypothetical protein